MFNFLLSLIIQPQKFIELKNTDNIIYEFPEEFKPEVDTEKENELEDTSQEIAQCDVSLSDLIEEEMIEHNSSLIIEYKPRNGQQRKYKAVVLDDGSLELLGQKFSSPSYAALAGIQDAGSDRQTVNGWTSWKTEQGQTIAELRNRLLNKSAESDTK